MKKALITGGAGFVGSHLADELLQRGYGAAVRVGQSMYQIAEYAKGNRMDTAVLLDALLDHLVERVVIGSRAGIAIG